MRKMKKISIVSSALFCTLIVFGFCLSPTYAAEVDDYAGVNISLEQRNTALSKYLIENQDRSLNMNGLTEEFFNKFPEYNDIRNGNPNIQNEKNISNIMRVDNIVQGKEIQVGDTKETYDIRIIYYKDGTFIIDSYVVYDEIEDQGTAQKDVNFELNATKSTSHQRTKEYYAKIFTKTTLIGKSTLIANFSYDGKIARCTSMRGMKQDFGVGMVWNSRPVETHPLEAPYYGKVSRVQMYSNCTNRGSGALLGVATIYVSCGPTGVTYDKVTL